MVPLLVSKATQTVAQLRNKYMCSLDRLTASLQHYSCKLESEQGNTDMEYVWFPFACVGFL